MIGSPMMSWAQDSYDLAFRAASGDVDAAAQSAQTARKQAAALDQGADMSAFGLEEFGTVAKLVIDTGGKAFGGYQQFQGMKQQGDQLKIQKKALQAQIDAAENGETSDW